MHGLVAGASGGQPIYGNPMSSVSLILLTLQGILFAFWAYLMFRTLFRLRKRGVEKSGSFNPGPLTMLGEFRNFLTLPEDRVDRNRLGLVTLLLFGIIALSAYVNSLG